MPDEIKSSIALPNFTKNSRNCKNKIISSRLLLRLLPPRSKSHLKHSNNGDQALHFEQHPPLAPSIQYHRKSRPEDQNVNAKNNILQQKPAPKFKTDIKRSKNKAVGVLSRFFYIFFPFTVSMACMYDSIVGTK
jgi:hypothetical protein